MLGSGLRLQLALFAGAGLAILAGASLNIQGYHGEQALIAVAAGILAWAGGVLSKRWKISAGLAIGAIALTAVEVRFSGNFFWINLAGILLLGLGGVVGAIGYEKLTDALRRRVTELQSLNEELEEQHRMFLAATEDPGLTFKDLGALNTATSRQTGTGFCCYYLLGADGRQFLPQLPAAGFEGRSPQLLIVRKEGGDPLLTPLEANQEYYAEDPDRLTHLARLFPTGFKVTNALVQPMLMNNRLGGFILLGNRDGGFGPDDKRLALTLAVRAAIHFGSQTAVSQTQEELARYTILNDIAKQASGLPFEEVMKLVIERARELVPYDACRVAIFGEDGTYTMLGGSPVASSIERGPLGEVKNGGKVLIRHLLTRSDGLFSGLDTGSETAQAAEALAPISGREGVFGALCLGRKGGIAFGDKDIPSLQELGAIAGVAVENSRILQRVSGQAFKVSSALDSLAEISEALTATTKGTATLEQKTLEVAARLAGGSHALLTRTESDGKNRVVNAVGFGREVVGLEIANGQGMVGAVMLSRQPLAVADVHDSFDLANPPDLAAAKVRGGVCVPIIHQQALWGTLAVFTADRKQWAEADLRVIATLANQAVVALQNAELFDSSNRMVWELQNLMGGLTAVTSTLNLEEVLEKVLASAAKACEAQIGVLALDERGKLEVKAAFGSDPETARRLALELGGEICQDVFASGKSFMHYADKARSSGPLDPQAVLCVPLTLRGKPIGVLFLANYAAGKPFTEDHKRVVTELGAQASVAIDNARLFREREVVVLESLTVMAALVDAKDPYTAGHSKRVTAYALQIARQMNYAPGNQEAWTRLERGCLLHDIGKINVPDAVLAKPGRLTDEEFDLLKKHPVVGYDVLKNLHMLTDELTVVRSHHERFDGEGYPDRKGGGDLPIIAFIAAAADAFDAMTSDRPYRRGMSLEVALSEISRGAGTHFHPDVAEALLDSAGKGEFKIIPQESLYKEAPVVGAFENPTG